MDAPLSAQTCDRIDPVTPQQWEKLFPAHPDPLALIRLVAASQMPNFEFASIVVRAGDRPVLLLPLFRTRLKVENLLESPARRIAAVLARLLPFLLHPRLLGVGFVEGEWGQIGIDRGLSPPQLAVAWKTALDELDRAMKRDAASMLLFLNLTPAAHDSLPDSLRSRTARIDTYPCARVPLPFATVDDYLATLGHATRKDLRRKLRHADAHGLRTQHTTDPAAFIDAIHDLYLRTVERAEMSLGIQSRAYFARVCQDVPGAHYVLYFRGNDLVAFNLLVRTPDALIDKYFCMEEAPGRQLALYFVSWMHNIAQCIDDGIAVYHAGPGAEATKARLGARFLPSVTLFRHRNPIVHGALRRLRHLLAYRPQVDLTQPDRINQTAQAKGAP
jgi:uncharacterized protein